jgi:hypothetical protein
MWQAAEAFHLLSVERVVLAKPPDVELANQLTQRVRPVLTILMSAAVRDAPTRCAGRS